MWAESLLSKYLDLFLVQIKFVWNTPNKSHTGVLSIAIHSDTAHQVSVALIHRLTCNRKQIEALHSLNQAMVWGWP